MNNGTGINHEMLERAVNVVRDTWPSAQPHCGLILGSGWSEVADAFNVFKTVPYVRIPGLGKPGVEGHSGRLVWAEASGVETLIFQGRRHWYEGEGWTPVALPVYLLKALGAKIVLLTNAAGGVRADLKPGSLMVIDDHINMMSANPLLGPHHPSWGARFPDQTAVYDSQLRQLLDKAGTAAGEKLAHGVYMAGSGPAYETPAEIRAFRTLGADAVGMSTVPEALLAHAAGLRVAGLSCISNSAAGVTGQPLSHEEVTLTTQASMARMKLTILQFWKEMHRAGI
jgi:purine-nucleoside phosphorylase